jgi:outer membrane receptor protein involved in Fe transport
VGLYHRDQSIDLERVYTFADADFASQFDTNNTALYGQVDFALNDQWSLTTGARLEQRDVEYSDNTAVNISTDEDLWGGRVALEYQADSGAFYYGLISRGYKPGGFNLDGNISAQERQFNTETMLNYELGFKQRYFNDSLQIQVSAFYQDRNDIQTKQSIVRSIATDELSGPCPCSFTDFTGNAEGGTNTGIELEANWQASEHLSLNLALGLLDTEFDTLLAFDHVNADRANGVAFD